VRAVGEVAERGRWLLPEVAHRRLAGERVVVHEQPGVDFRKLFRTRSTKNVVHVYQKNVDCNLSDDILSGHLRVPLIELSINFDYTVNILKMSRLLQIQS
jgi:hypothetical protein